MTITMPASVAERVFKIVRKKDLAVQYGPIGVDFVHDGIRLVQFRKVADRLEVHASVHVSMTEERLGSSSDLRVLMKNTLKQNGFVGRDIVTCLQPENVKIMMLSYMHQNDQKDEEQIVQRVAERIEEQIENYVIDYMMVRPEAANGQERSVLVALAERDRVIHHLEYLRKAGLKVKVLEIEPTAVRRLISVKHGSDHKTNLMTISMGLTKTYIMVLSGRRLIYQRDIHFGEIQLITMLCRELDISEHEARTMLQQTAISDAADNQQAMAVTDAFYGVLKPLFMELVEDINQALIYAASETRGIPVKQVYLTDRVATWPGIDRFINTLIEVQVEVLMPFAGFNNTAVINADAGPRSAVVTGTALYGLAG